MSDTLKSLIDQTDVVAVTFRQSLVPLEGPYTPIFPATYPAPERGQHLVQPFLDLCQQLVVIDLSRDGKAMVKCDQCIERTQRGEDPACVAACRTKALRFVELDEYLRHQRREAAQRVVEVRQRPGGPTPVSS